MNAKKRILGGAILTALAGTGAYFCSNNDDKLQTSYEKTSIEQSIRAEQSEQDFLDIIAKPYLGEKTLEKEIAKETPAEKKPESLDERISRLSKLFEEKYNQCVSIQRDYESKREEGKIISSNGEEWKYQFRSKSIELYLSSNLCADIAFNYNGTTVEPYRWVLGGKEQGILFIKKYGNDIFAGTQEELLSKSDNRKKIENFEDIRGFTNWKYIISDIIRLHPDKFK